MLPAVRISIIVQMANDIVHSATIENKNSRHFAENAQLINFPESLQTKLAKVTGKFTLSQVLALVKQEVCDLTELNQD